MNHNKECETGFKIAVEVLGSKWNITIIWLLCDGPLRFTELQKSLGDINPQTVTKHLRALEKDRMVTRTVYPEVPPRVEYTLTENGKALIPVLNTIAEWGSNLK